MSMVEVCAHGVQPACVFGRSIWPSLVSALSTLALSSAANWDLPFFAADEDRIEDRCWAFTFYAFVAVLTPLLPLLQSLANASKVWAVKQSMRKRGQYPNNLHRESMSILCVCPLFLEVPLPDPLPEEMRGLLNDRSYQVLEGYPKEWYPLELSAGGHPHPDTPAAQSAIKKTYLQLFLNTDVPDAEELQEREVLLTSGLVPEYNQLRFLRSKSRFQTIVTGLQAGGYVLSVLQRLAQHLAVSPLEALVCMLSLVMLLQLLLELYACSHYQRPLLLRLNNHDQFLEFWRAPRDTSSINDNSIKRSYIVFGAAFLGLPVTVFGGLSIYYAVHYMPSCLLCSITALLFLFSSLSFLAFIMLPDEVSDTLENILGVVFCSGTFAFAGSVMLAIVSTATHWDLFHSPITNSFTWILPHISA